MASQRRVGPNRRLARCGYAVAYSHPRLQVQGGAMRYFFLSYARGQHDDLVEKFFVDLSGEVREHAGRDRKEEVGFLDRRSLQVGDHWPPTLIDGLQSCRTFLALCSPRYFRSVACGKEWWVFSQRLARYRTDSLPPPALIPLFWLPTKIPSHLTDLQYRDPSFGTPYDDYGLRRLLQLSKHRDDYLEFVTSVAVRITETAEDHDLPALVPLPTFASAVNAFRPPDSRTPSAAPVPAVGSRPAKLPLLTYEEDHDDDERI